MMLPYQNDAVNKLIGLLPSGGTARVLEIGSDISALVSSTLAERNGAFVVGVNPAVDFPLQYPVVQKSNLSLIRGDGRCLPFADNSFDGVFSIATMEHVNGLGLLLDEVNRVLKGFSTLILAPSGPVQLAITFMLFLMMGKRRGFGRRGETLSRIMPTFTWMIMSCAVI